MKKSVILIVVLIIIAGVFAGLYLKSEKDRKVEQARIAEAKRIEEQRVLEEQQREQQRKEEYKADLIASVAMTYAGSVYNYMSCSLIQHSWSSGIDDDTVSESLALMKKLMKDKGLNDKLANLKNDVDDLMKKLQDPPEGFALPYKYALDMYGYYVQLYSQAISPSGSYISYNQELNKNYTEMEKLFNQICIVIPEVKRKAEEAKKKIVA